VLFNLVQAKVLRRGRFPSKQDLTAKLLAYIERFNQERTPQPDPNALFLSLLSRAVSKSGQREGRRLRRSTRM